MDGYRFRAATPDDLGGIGDLLAADDIDDAGRPVLDGDFVREGWSTPGFDPATDAWVVVSDGDGAIVGYGHSMLGEPDVVRSWGAVHPAHRRRGIGTAMLDRIEARAGEQLAGRPSARLRHSINAGDRAAVAMLEARRLHLIRHFWHMEIELAGPVEPGPMPDGVEIRGIVTPDDLPDVHAVIDEAFADHWGHDPEPFDGWVEEQTSSPTYDPTLWLLATDGGQPVGALNANIFGGRGWVAELGVRASHRGRGIGGALLGRSFATFADRGARRVLLNVDAENPTGATALYERMGMRVVKRWDLWERAA